MKNSALFGTFAMLLTLIFLPEGATAQEPPEECDWCEYGDCNPATGGGGYSNCVELSCGSEQCCSVDDSYFCFPDQTFLGLDGSVLAVSDGVNDRSIQIDKSDGGGFAIFAGHAEVATYLRRQCDGAVLQRFYTKNERVTLHQQAQVIRIE